jgi:hypothetical protein
MKQHIAATRAGQAIDCTDMWRIAFIWASRRRPAASSILAASFAKPPRMLTDYVVLIAEQVSP